jgi:hypothetical protein
MRASLSAFKNCLTLIDSTVLPTFDELKKITRSYHLSEEEL